MATFRNATVVNSIQITPHLQRIILGGEDLKTFPQNEEGAYVKLILEKDKALLENSKHRPKMRSYTVAEYDEKDSTLALDFVINMHDGLSTNWAKNTRPGEQVVIAGPGPRKIYDFPETDYLFFVDLTSINALRAYLKLLPEKASGKAIVLVPSHEDFLDLPTKSSVAIHFKVSPLGYNYLEFAKSYENLSDKTIVFAAGEANEINALRKYLLKERCLPTENVYISGYWKKGKNDEEYRDEKRQQTNLIG